MKTLVFSLICVAFAVEVQAQTIISVPYDKADFFWDAPVNPLPPNTGITKYYVLNCGGVDVQVNAPATSVAVSAVVSQPGQYSCTIKAGNDFGLSAAVAFPTFSAGFAPTAPANARIEIR